MLKANARLLIGIAFGFAVFWKVISPEFYDGSVMEYKLLYDFRFRNAVAKPICGMTEAEKQHNLNALKAILSTGSDETNVQLEYPDSISTMATFLTWWTIAIEFALAVAFLLPIRWSISVLRNGLLILFAISTYLIVPVLGFGNLFMVMGIAQCERNEWRTKIAYTLSFVLLVCWYSVASHLT